jgi:hypothetical protein
MLRNDLPRRTGEELTMTELIEHIPDGMLEGGIGGPENVQSFGVRVQPVVLGASGLLAVQILGHDDRGKIPGQAEGDAGRAVAGLGLELGGSDFSQVVRERLGRLARVRIGVCRDHDRQSRLAVCRQGAAWRRRLRGQERSRNEQGQGGEDQAEAQSQFHVELLRGWDAVYL